MPSQFKNVEIVDTGYLTLPSGTSSERPSQPESGMIRYNTDLGETEWYDSDRSDWFPLRDTNQFVSATGGTVVDTEINGRPYRLHYFTETGTDTFTITKGGDIDVLVVAGGGGAEGNSASGGGGAGGVIFKQRYNVSSDAYSVVVGEGGQGSSSDNGASSGQDSVFGNLTAIGGGKGSFDTNPSSGGSGGGGGGGSTPGTNTGASGLQPESQSGGFGNNGGSGYRESGSRQGGGGGGAGAPGGDGLRLRNPGSGGAGISVNLTGNIEYYGGGGGGAAEQPSYTKAGRGGLGGGGNGGGPSPSPGQNGFKNTGGGGGGAKSDRGGDGGSGIVIVRYPRDPDATYSQPDKTDQSQYQNQSVVVNEGLIFNVDASDIRSYKPGDGVWRDLANKNDFSLSGPTWNNDYGGYFSFEADYARNTSPTITSINSNSVCAWIRPRSVNGYNTVLDFDNDDFTMFIYDGDFRTFDPTYDAGANIQPNQWVHIARSHNNGGPIRLFVNGILFNTTENESVTKSFSQIVIGNDNNFGTGEDFVGDIAQIQLYDRALSNEEIRHNFNVTRGRFGV